MNSLLIVRSEIISILIIIFLILYDRYCAHFREGKDYFISLAVFCLGHVAMALATEITVNMDDFPTRINDILHIIFFAFGLLYSLEYFKYTLSLVVSRPQRRKIAIPLYVISSICVIIMVFSKIDYLQGNGTKYSAGIGPSVCYGLAAFVVVFSDAIMIVKWKRIENLILITILPLSFATIILMCIQIAVPEFLFTGGALTILTVGIFFSIENPMKMVGDKAFIDRNTQTWNRNSYEHDLNERVKKAISNSTNIIYVLTDINGLKRINDSYGHVEGDRIIEVCATIMLKDLTLADRIYRIGGDEFAALYFNKDVSQVEEQLRALKESCDEYNNTTEKKLFLSAGYAQYIPGEDFSVTIKRADQMMYSQKELFYRENVNNRRRR